MQFPGSTVLELNGQSSEDSSNGSNTSAGSYVKLEIPHSEFPMKSGSQFSAESLTASDLNFVSPSDSDTQSVSGSLEGNWGSSQKRLIPGASYLQQKGFGWLMEVDDSETEDDSSLLDELDIDPKDILFKIRCVLFPVYSVGYDRRMIRDSPDFWGPLLVVLLFAGISLYGQLQVVSWIITMWIFGSLVIFLLARVLGGDVNYSQCLGVIGYSILPLVVTGTATIAFNAFQNVSLFIKMCGVVWATYSAGSLLCVQELRNKRPLLLYPIFLLYVYFLSLYLGV